MADGDRTAEAAVRLDGLVKRFGSVTALDHVSLLVPRGSVVGLIGPNGAGKTTLMRILLDVIRPSAGSATVLGESPRAGGPALRRRIGYLPGELQLDKRSTGRSLLDFYAQLSGPVAPGRIEELAERLGLDLDRRAHTLSKGNKQKLGLVQAFMHAPPLLVLDEPTSGLDPLVQQTFLDLVREAREAGQTVLLSSHVLSEIEQVADRVAILRRGTLVDVNTVEALRAAASSEVRLVVAGTAHGRHADGTDTGHAISAILAAVPGTAGVSVAPVGGTSALWRVRADFRGEPDALIAALGTLRVHELSIDEPNLEETVLALYGLAAPADSRTGAES